MPEFIFIGIIGAAVTFVVVNINLYFVHLSFQKKNFRNLANNLSKVGKYWSLEQGRVLDFGPLESEESARKRDYSRATKSAFLFGTMMIFLSWLGLLFFLIYFISTHFLARSRFEEDIFSSALAGNQELEKGQVEEFLKQLQGEEIPFSREK